MNSKQPETFTFNGDPKARLTKYLRTPRQMTAFSAIERYEGVDVDAECQALLGCRVADLTIWAASALIGWFKSPHFRSALVVTCSFCKCTMNASSTSRVCLYCVLDEVA